MSRRPPHEYTHPPLRTEPTMTGRYSPARPLPFLYPSNAYPSIPEQQSVPIDPALLLDPQSLVNQLNEARSQLGYANTKIQGLEAEIKQKDTAITGLENAAVKQTADIQKFEQFRKRAGEKYERAVEINETLSNTNQNLVRRMQQLEEKLILKDQKVAEQHEVLREWQNRFGMRGLAAEIPVWRTPESEHNEADYGDPRLALIDSREVDRKKAELDAENARYAVIAKGLGM